MDKLSATSSWIKTKSDELAVSQGCYFDIRAAERVRTFADKFVRGHTGEWAGKPFKFVDWQWKDLVAPLFGWKQADGRRRFNRFGVGIPKKNGKSTLLAVLSLYMLIGDREPNAEVYILGSEKPQGKIIYQEAAKFVTASPELGSVINDIDYHLRLESKLDGSFLQVLAGTNKGKHGFNSHLTVFDELHEQRNWELWNTFRYAGDARRQSILGWLSTAGFDPDRPWLQEWQYVRDVLDGKLVDVSFLPVLYEAGETDDYTDEEVWKKANPSMGVTIQLAKMRSDFEEAKNKGSITLRDFRILKLNQVIREGGSPYISRDAWDLLAKPGVEVEPKKCVAALDLASTRDINALVFGDMHEDKLRVEPYFWCPSDTAKKEQSNSSLYRAWTEAGWLRRTPGSYIDWKRLAQDIIPLLKAKKPKKILADPHMASLLITFLAEAGFKVETFTQTPRNFNSATRDLERLVLSGTVEHNGSQVMSWMVGNSTLSKPTKEGYVMVDRSTNRLRKIDGLPATLMVLAELSKETQNKAKRFVSW